MTITAPVKTHVANALVRYYDPATAQFTTPDPLFALTGERYGYAGNDPVNGTDPTGLSIWNPCIGHTCASDVASGTVNATVTVGTAGTSNCVRYVTCSSSTASVPDTHPVPGLGALGIPGLYFGASALGIDELALVQELAARLGVNCP